MERRRFLQAAAIILTECGTDSRLSYRETPRVTSTPRDQLNPPSLIDQLNQAALLEANKRLLQLENTYAGKNLNEIPQEDFEGYIRNSAQLYSLLGTNGKIVYENFVRATQVVGKEEYALLFSGEQQQLRPRLQFSDTMAIVVDQQGPKVYINKDADAFTQEGSKKIDSSGNQLVVFGRFLVTGYKEIAPEFKR